MEIVPLVIFSSPATIRNVVDFPYPERPKQHHELTVLDVQIDVLDRRKRRAPTIIAIRLDQIVDFY
jgi:hypothetical protein